MKQVNYNDRGDDHFSIVFVYRTPVVYYLEGAPPPRGFVREELLVVPSDTQQPPSRLP